MKIGFIGLGAMGRHMAARLESAGHALQSFDLNGKGNCKSAGEALQGVEVLFTSLPGPAEVESISKSVAPGAVWFDTSTNSPDVVRRIQAKIHGFLDAPVSGGPKGAESGKLAIWIGGDPALFRKYKFLLKQIGDQPFYVGPIGAGTIAKLAHNCASFAIQTALAEVMTLGVKAGVEPLALFKAIRQGASGRKRTFDRLPEHFLPGKYDPAAFTLRLAHKDLTLALELARQQKVPMRIAEAVLAEFNESMQRGWAERDCRVAMTLQEERAGVSVRVAPERLQGVLD
ncbi:MAG TPA: NAD(P)-dependent oxidoreductase [Burkholderiales bacterium]